LQEQLLKFRTLNFYQCQDSKGAEFNFSSSKGAEFNFSSEIIESPCSKLQGIFDRKEICYFYIRSLIPQQAAGNALAIAVQLSFLISTSRRVPSTGTRGI
jgi:hypothetical protein